MKQEVEFITFYKFYITGSGYSNNIKRMIDQYDLRKYDEIVLKNNDKNDDEYQKALKVFYDKGIMSSDIWKDPKNIKEKHIVSLIIKTSKVL